MTKEASDICLCQEHREIVFHRWVDGVVEDTGCMYGCTGLDIDETIDGIGWVFSWEELGFDYDPLERME